MRIQDFDSICDVTKPADIMAALSKRHSGGINSFWLSHGVELFPAINIVVKGGDLANVHYLPRDRDAGFMSLAEVFGPIANEIEVFFIGLVKRVGC